MPRRHYLITYDVSDDKRRTRLFKLLEGEGDHAQYSVFFCDLTPAELASTRARITELIHDREDQVLILNAEGELILARLNPEGYHEQSRTPIIGPTWAHPAYAGSTVYARDDTEVVAVSLLPEGTQGGNGN